MPSFARSRAAVSLLLATLSGIAGCSRRPDPPAETGTVDNEVLELERSSATQSTPDTQNLASVRPDPQPPAPATSAEEESPDTTSTPEAVREPAPRPQARPEPDTQPRDARTGSGALLAREPAETARTESADDEPIETGRALPAGTTIKATLQDSINSRQQSAGDVVAARIRQPVKDRRGRVVVPAGSRVELSIAELEPAKAAEPEDARLVLKADSILINGRPHPVDAEVQAVEYQLQGRGVTGKEAGKVGIGAAAGAVLGRILSGETEGAVVGGAVGAAGGGAVAARRARKDVVVKPGTELVMVLREPLVLPE